MFTLQNQNNMPELIVKRKKQFFTPANCCFHVYIDNEKQTTLSNGDKDQLTIEEGVHTLQVRNNYFTSRKKNFVIGDQQTMVIETFSMPILGWLYVLAPVILIIFSALKLFHVAMPGILFSLALAPLFLFIVLALFLGFLKKALLIKLIP